MFATQVLPETDFEEKPKCDDSEIVGIISVGDKNYEISKGETKIGRDPNICSVVLESFTVSKLHAVIESDGVDDSFIYDVGSTNQTKIGKKCLKPHCRYKLDDKSEITFGNVVAKFSIPTKVNEGLNSYLATNTPPNSGSNILNELDDIFELSTQVNTPQPSTSKQCEKTPSTFQVFKIPFQHKKVSAVKPCIEPEPEPEPEPHPLLCKTGQNIFGNFEDSDIFSITTQCHLSGNFSPDKKDENASTEAGNEAIFDVATQCQSQVPSCSNIATSKKGEDIPERSDNKTVLSSSSELPKSVSVEVNNDVHCDSGEDTVDFFKSQSQSLKSTSHIESKSTENNTTVKISDGIKSFLNDDQDDNLCTFMSLHSPNTNSESDKIEVEPSEGKTETFESLSQEKDICNQEIEQLKEVLLASESFNEYNTESKTNAEEVNQQEPNDANTKSLKISSQKTIIVESSDQTAEDRSQSSTESYLEIVLDDDDIQCEDDFIATQVFSQFKQNSSHKLFDLNKKENNAKDEQENEDLIATQSFDLEKSEVRPGGEKIASFVVKESSDESDADLFECSTQIFEESDFIGTPSSKKTEKISAEGIKTIAEKKENEDSIETQFLPLTQSKSRNVQDGSPDLLDGNFLRQLDNLESAAVFGNKDKTDKSQLLEISEINNSYLSKDFVKKEKESERKVSESSGDETESDLEIILDDENAELMRKFSIEKEKESHKCKSQMGKTQFRSHTPENFDNEASYIFHLEDEDEKLKVEKDKENLAPLTLDVTDSDVTDCEEIEGMNLIPVMKEEPANNEDLNETQVLTLTLPNGLARKSPDIWMMGEESPKFEIGDSAACSLLMENTDTEEKVETTAKRILEKDKSRASNEEEKTPSKMQRIEVRIDDGYGHKSKPDSPMKRIRNSDSSGDIPLKKSRRGDAICDEKKLQKLWQAHDITQIQSSRTRSTPKKSDQISSKQDDASVTKKPPPSRRKSNGTRRNSTSKQKTETTSSKKIERKKSFITSPEDSVPDSKTEKIKSVGRILRTRRRNSSNLPCAQDSPKLRRSSRSKNELSLFYNVVFTGFDCEPLDRIIVQLGGKKCKDLSGDEVVVITDKVRRTVKFLCAVGLGLPIVTSKWLLASQKESRFLNPWDFILNDEESERNFDFNLKTSLELSKKRKLLEGYTVFATENSKPPVEDLYEIVKCCGGTPICSPPAVWPKFTIFVSCVEDKKFWPLPKYRQVRLVHYEFILSGVIRQQLDFKLYKLR